MKKQVEHHQILIVGGGTGGIMTASTLKRKDPSLDIAIIEPSKDHYYQPAWTLVGAGTYNYEDTRRTEASVIPVGTKWIKDKAIGFDPGNNEVETEKNGSISYDILVIAPGLVYDFSLIEGLNEAFEKGVVCSNYVDPRYTWNCLQKFKGGNAVFTQPGTPIKCGGAPQKIMYLAADYFKKNNLSDKTHIIFATPGSVIFGVKEIAATLQKVLKRDKVNFNPFHTPVKIDADKKVAYFKLAKEGKFSDDIPRASYDGKLVSMPFELLHLAPPQTAPKCIQNSPLANDAGWLDVDDFNLQHKKYDNIFGVGDVNGIPAAKTGAATRKQAYVVIDNVLEMVHGKAPSNDSYDGYSSCPLVTGYGKMVLAEFNYKNEFTPDPNLKKMLVFDSSKEHWRLWLLKKYGLPYMYWNKMLKGEVI